MSTIKSLEDFQTWQKSKQVNELVSVAVKNTGFNSNLKFKNQIINASVSVMANLAEGLGREGNAEFIQFISIAKASSVELRSHIHAAGEFGLIEADLLKEIINLSNEVEAMATTLMIKIKASKFKGAKYK